MNTCKERFYSKLPEFAHCPNCHRRVNMPSFLKTAKIGGSIRVNCGSCKSGVVVIKPMKVEDEARGEIMTGVQSGG